MIRRNQAFLNHINALADMLLVIAAYALSSWIWLDLMGGSSRNMAKLSVTSLLMACVYSVLVFILLSLFSFYNSTRTRRLTWKLRIIFIAVTLAVLLASSLLFLLKLIDFSRGVLYLFYLLSMALLMGKYIAMRVLFSQMRAKGYNLKHMLVIGSGRLAAQFDRDAFNDRGLGIRVIGFVGKGGEDCAIDPDRYMGNYGDLDRLLANQDIQEAVIALDPEEYAHIRDMIASCEKNGVKYYVLPFYNDMIPAHPIIESVGGSKLIDMRANRLDNLGWSMIKRLFDLAASGLGLILLSPLLLLLAVGVKLSSPGPILFRQTRIGYQRREFQMLKFRSMRQSGEENTRWSQKQDDRRTRFGSLIRKTSLDELPQLWNVFRGDMSLVGPRPELPYFVEQFRETIPLYMVKHQVKPGITGWAQVNGYRGDTSIQKRIELDLWYIDNWSVWLDIRIMFRTLFGGMLNKEMIG